MDDLDNAIEKFADWIEATYQRFMVWEKQAVTTWFKRGIDGQDSTDAMSETDSQFSVAEVLLACYWVIDHRKIPQDEKDAALIDTADYLRRETMVSIIGWRDYESPLFFKTGVGYSDIFQIQGKTSFRVREITNMTEFPNSLVVAIRTFLRLVPPFDPGELE